MEGIPNFNFLPDDYNSEFSGERKKDKSKEKSKDGKLKSSRFLSFLTREEGEGRDREPTSFPLKVIEGGGERDNSLPSPDLAVVPDRFAGGAEARVTQFEAPDVVMPEASQQQEQQSSKPSGQETTPEAEPSNDRFSKWMLEAGFEPDFVQANAMLAEQSVDSKSLDEVHDPAVSEESKDDSRENINRYKARRSSLVAFAAGLLIGNHFGKDRVRRELQETNTKLEKLEVSGRQLSLADQQRERDEYNRQYWKLSTHNRQPNGADVSGETEDEEGNPFDRKPETHVERDAWHSIVVDKYNHEDIDARQMYGQEFLREQREVAQQQPQDQQYVGSSIGVNNPSTGQQAQPTYQTSVQQDNSYSLPDGMTEPELPSGQPTRVDPQHLLKTASKQSVSLVVNPWVWLVLGLLILVFFIASLL